jgi:hypothetical protein
MRKIYSILSMPAFFDFSLHATPAITYVCGDDDNDSTSDHVVDESACYRRDKNIWSTLRTNQCQKNKR